MSTVSPCELAYWTQAKQNIIYQPLALCPISLTIIETQSLHFVWYFFVNSLKFKLYAKLYHNTALREKKFCLAWKNCMIARKRRQCAPLQLIRIKYKVK